MKRTTTIKYECSDGRVFTDPQTAKEHEILVTAETLRGETEKRLTAAEMIRLMVAYPDRFVAVLQEFYAEGCDRKEGETEDQGGEAEDQGGETENQGNATPERGAGGRFKSVRSDTAAE